MNFNQRIVSSSFNCITHLSSFNGDQFQSMAATTVPTLLRMEIRSTKSEKKQLTGKS